MARLTSDSPSTEWVAITPNDSTDLTGIRAIYVGVTGDIALSDEDAPTTSVTFKNVPQGTILPVAVKRVYSTGTTATDLVGLR